MNKKKNVKTTQKYLDIAEIREDTVVLKDGTLRVVLLASSINFALKSDEEQEAIIQAYVNFLNSFEHPLQIVIQSRKLNVENYINSLQKLEKEQTNELLRMQTAEYRSFVKELIDMGDIMNKRFFVVVPYNPLSDKQKSFISRLVSLFQPGITIKLGKKKFKRRKNALFQRVEHIRNGLSSLGVSAIPLDTQAIIELFYNTYNPDMGDKQKLVDVRKFQLD
ncbi:hypothetical protein ACFL23_03195 [Patescibacteria group bacterium]